MPSITFTEADRKSITRRQIRIDIENAAFISSKASVTAGQVALLEVDTGNEKFHDFYKVQATAYQNEVLAMDGTISDDYTVGIVDPFSAGDLVTSAKSPGLATARFFQPGYEFLIPEVVGAINGIANPTGTAARYEQNILNDVFENDGLTAEILAYTAGLPGSVTDTLGVGGYTPGSGTMSVVTGTGYVVGEYIVIEDGINSALLRIDGAPVGPTPFAVPVIAIKEAAATVASGGSVSSFSGFTNSERDTQVSTTLQNVLTLFSTNIDSIVTEWRVKVNDQLTQLALNNDDRGTQATQITSAISTNTSDLSDIDTWIALPSTGAGGRFVDANLIAGSTLFDLQSLRLSRVTTRKTEIITALGAVVQTGDAFSGIEDETYFERYKWLNFRINKVSGSARRFFASNEGSDILQSLIDDNTSIQTSYDEFFLTKAITTLEPGSDIIEVKDVVGLAPSDTLTVVSETQGEITRTIVSVQGTTQLELNSPIPNTYLTVDTARVFKTL